MYAVFAVNLMRNYDYFLNMKAVLFSLDEIEEKIKCNACNQINSEGFFLDSENDEEYEFLETIFRDISNGIIGSCCIDRFAEICLENGFALAIKAGLPLKTVFAL